MINKLISDIKVISNFSLEDLATKLSINTGNSIQDKINPVSTNYLSDCYIPKMTWRPLDSNERLLLLSQNQYFQSENSISLVRILDLELADLRKILIVSDNNLESENESYYTIKDDNLFNQELIKITEHVKKYTLPNTSIKCLGLNSSLPGLITTTRDEINYLPHRPYIGLHVDSWQNAPLKLRHRSSNRLCINIGTETRYFLFINLSLLKIFQILGFRNPEDVPQFYRGTGLPELFLRTYPDYPVLKLAIAPNEAYIAPTENMIHDASSIDKHSIDVNLTFLGKFQPPPL